MLEIGVRSVLVDQVPSIVVLTSVALMTSPLARKERPRAVCPHVVAGKAVSTARGEDETRV